MAIKPLDLPSSAGVSYGQGDVRHFSEDDGVNVSALQNPTRHLAERDNLMAAKLNETIAVVNNKEQFVPLPILRTAVVPGTEEVVANFRIPVGYEARILNSAIASTPASTDLTLKIAYGTSYGNTTGIELVSTSDEFSSGTAFYNTGELIVSIRNNGAATLEASASVTLTVRPIAERGSLLVGSVIQGEKGNRGDKGDKGDKGDPGSGAASSPFVWKGEYAAAQPYVPGDVVTYVDKITNPAATGSSYRNKAASTGVLPTVTANWDVFASGGGLNYKGSFTSGTWPATAWALNDFVAYNNGTVTSSYICKLAAASTAVPTIATANWDLFVSGISPGSAETPTYAHTQLIGTGGGTPVAPYAALDGSYVGGATSGDYTGGGTPGTNVARTVQQYTVRNTATTPKGLAFLHSADRLVFKGIITVYLPQQADGAAVNWSTSYVRCIATVDVQDAEGSPPVDICKVSVMTASSFRLEVNTTNARKVTITMVGVQEIP